MSVSQEEIIAGIAEIIEEVTGIEPSEITPEKSFVDDLDIDSLSMVEIAVQTEDKYGVKIPDEDLAGLRTVGDVVNYIQKLEEENPEAAQALRAKFESDPVEAGSRQQVTKPSTANGGYPNVVVTAVTATTSISPDIEGTWKGLLAGESGIRVLEDEFVTKWDLQVKIGGHLKESPDDHMGRLDMRRMSYVQRMAKHLSGQLWENAGSPEVDPDRFTVVVGTGLGGAEKIVESYDLMNEGGPRKVSPLAVQMIMPNGAAAVVGLQLGARAGVMTPVSACSSGSEAIAHAWRQIVMGDADFAVCGGVEGNIEALPIAAFSMMRAMSTRNEDPEGASRPFDKERDGFVFGEAGAMMMIETEEHAKARGAKPLARLMGAGITSDAFHMVAPAADGVRAGRAMARALELAGLSPKDIDHINAHATATPIGDTAEANAIRVAGCEQAAIYAPKGALGHSIGAVGALESILTVLALRDGVIPPTLNYTTPDPGDRPRRRRGRATLWRVPVRHQQLVRFRRTQRRVGLRAVLSSIREMRAAAARGGPDNQGRIRS